MCPVDVQSQTRARNSSPHCQRLCTPLIRIDGFVVAPCAVRPVPAYGRSDSQSDRRAGVRRCRRCYRGYTAAAAISARALEGQGWCGADAGLRQERDLSY